MANSKLKAFVVFCNRVVGETVKAKDFNDLLENRVTNKLRIFWSEIKFKDEDGNTICIERRFMDEDGMSFEECVEDFKLHASEDDLSEEILTTR